MPQSAEEQEAQAAKAEAEAERRGAALASLMDPKARERLSRIALVKPEKAQALENMLLQAAQRGQLGGKVTEDALIKMLEENGAKLGKDVYCPIVDSDSDNPPPKPTAIAA